MSLGSCFTLHGCSPRPGPSLEDVLNKEKKPCIYVGMVCVREAYQGQGYMRKVMDLAFAEGDRLGIPVVLDTDAKSKCDKYVHLGMKLYGTRDLGPGGTLYDLVRYPKRQNKIVRGRAPCGALPLGLQVQIFSGDAGGIGGHLLRCAAGHDASAALAAAGAKGPRDSRRCGSHPDRAQ